MYKICLRPLGPYFFGTERGFGGTDNASYFASSRHFPQQSAVLGMLRYRLLEMKGWLTDAAGKSKATPQERMQLIGPHGFYPDKARNSLDYGVIQSIDPMWLEDKNGMLLPGPLDQSYAYSTREGEYLHLNSQKVMTGLPHLGTAFDPKNTTVKHLVRIPPQKQSIEWDQVFVESQRVGITKDRSISEDKAFFKQQYFQLNPERETKMVFYASLEKAAGDALMEYVGQYPLINFGGERSTFHMVITREAPPTNIPEAYSQNASQEERWVLLSDAYIPQTQQGDFRFGVTAPDFYRGLLSNTESTRRYSELYRNNRKRNPSQDQAVKTESPRKSDGYPLFARGSVLYPDPEKAETLEKTLYQATQGWQQVGYNRIVRVKNGQCNYLFENLTTKPS